jgi:putative acetyltransferase
MTAIIYINMKESIDQRNILFKIANTTQEFDDARNLFQQYATSVGIDLCFQDFPNELKTIDQQYHKPKGALLLAYKNKIAVGCAGLREFGKEAAELKRMFVKTEYRGYKIGQRMLELIIDIARELKYKKILLDTLSNMTQAQKLYQSFGFYEISSYRFNPIEGAVFMEMKLT